MSNDDTFMSRLIEETYTEPLEKDQSENVFDLRNYFEKRLNQVDHLSLKDYLGQHLLTCKSLTLSSITKCYRLIINEFILDFPSNWSIFAEIDKVNLICLDPSEDQDSLLDIFSEVSGSYWSIALFRENEDVQLVFVPELESREHFNWMKNYFEKKIVAVAENKAA